MKIFQCEKINDSISTFILTAQTSIFVWYIPFKKRIMVKIKPLQVDILELVSGVSILKTGYSKIAEWAGSINLSNL